ncbi:MAG: hypothetical protein R3A48_02370 [Polyangiales bacterium]
MTVQYSSSTDTADDRAGPGDLAELQNPRRREELSAENVRLRRELEGASRQRRALEESGGADGASRRQALLRDALTRKDQEILALKGQLAARDRAALEWRDQGDRARRERAELEERLRLSAAVEAERAQLARALETARRDAEQTAAALVHADGVVAEWRAALERVTRELDDARRQVAEMNRVGQELRAAWESAQAERQRAAEAHAEQVTALRAQHAAALEQVREGYERLLAEGAARVETMRASQSVALRELEDAHAQELAAERAGRIRAEEAAAAEVARRDEAARKLDEVDRKTADLDRVHEGYAREIAALQAAHARDLEEMQSAQERAVQAARDDAGSDARSELLLELESLRAVIEERDALSAELDAQRDRAAQLEALCVAAEQSAREALEAMRARDATLRDDLEAETAALREAHAEALAAIERSLADEKARADGLHEDLQRTREALGTYAAECAERLDAADRIEGEARSFRERMTRRLADAVERLRVTTERAQADADALSGEIRRLTSLVGRLTARVVVQGARTTAHARGAAAPEGDDLDDAISRIADDLPDAVAAALWDARDDLLRRALHSSAPC